MSKKDNCQMDLNVDNDCSNGTCAPVSPFSKEGALFLIFLLIILAVLFLILFFNGLL